MSRSLASVALALALVAAGPGASAYNDRDKDDMIVLDGESGWVTVYAVVKTQVAAMTGEDNLLADGDPAERIGTRLRQARFGVEGWAWGIIDWEVTMQMQEGGARLLDAWIGYRRYQSLMMVIGAHKAPFSRFRLQGSQYGTIAERALGAVAMAPGRQVGITLEGKIGRIIDYRLGVYNGFERSTNFHEGYVQNPGFDGNRNNGLAWVGRLQLEPFGGVGKLMADFKAKDSFRLSLGTATYINDGETTTGNGFEADLLAKWRGLHVAFEYLADVAEPVKKPATTATIPASLDRHAIIGELGYMIIPTVLGFAVRGELIDDDRNQEDAGDGRISSGGLQPYSHGTHMKASVEYTHREELSGDERDNDTLLFQLQFGI